VIHSLADAVFQSEIKKAEDKWCLYILAIFADPNTCIASVSVATVAVGLSCSLRQARRVIKRWEDCKVVKRLTTTAKERGQTYNQFRINKEALLAQFPRLNASEIFIKDRTTALKDRKLALLPGRTTCSPTGSEAVGQHAVRPLVGQHAVRPGRTTCSPTGSDNMQSDPSINALEEEEDINSSSGSPEQKTKPKQSRHGLDVIRQYVTWKRDVLKVQVRSVHALARTMFNDASEDSFIDAWLLEKDNPEIQSSAAKGYLGSGSGAGASVLPMSSGANTDAPETDWKTIADGMASAELWHVVEGLRDDAINDNEPDKVIYLEGLLASRLGKAA